VLSSLSVGLLPEDNKLTQRCIALPLGSSEHLVQIQHWDFFYGEWGVTKLNNRKIGFKSITENIDTTTSGGKLVFHIFGALAEFGRDIISERTNAGLSAARARGRLGGRPKAKMLDTPKKVALAQSLYENRNNTIDEICKTLNVSRATLYRYIQTKEK